MKGLFKFGDLLWCFWCIKKNQMCNLSQCRNGWMDKIGNIGLRNRLLFKLAWRLAQRLCDGARKQAELTPGVMTKERKNYSYLYIFIIHAFLFCDNESWWSQCKSLITNFKTVKWNHLLDKYISIQKKVVKAN